MKNVWFSAHTLLSPWTWAVFFSPCLKGVFIYIVNMMSELKNASLNVKTDLAVVIGE